MTYSEKLKDPRWQKKRLKILERDEWKCMYCGDAESQLQVHHKKYHGEPWDAPDDDLETACLHCHSIIYKYSTEEIPIQKVHKKCCSGETSHILFAVHENIGQYKDRGRFIAIYEIDRESEKPDLTALILQDELDIIKKLFDFNGTNKDGKAGIL